MTQPESNEGVQNVVPRVTRIEQVLPTLATKDDLDAAVAPLATKAELAHAVTSLRKEVRETAVETRGHFDVAAEGLRSEIRLLAEGIVANQERIEAVRTELKGDIAQVDHRVTRLAAPRAPRKPRT